jgi:plastocyanin
MNRVWIVVPAALLLSACGGDSGTQQPASKPLQTINVTEKEFSITPKTLSVSKTGVYAFAITNHGMITHGFEIDGNGVDERGGDIAPGSTVTLKVDLSKRGSYSAFCPIDGHRSKGMEATLTVGAGSSGAGQPTTTVPTTSGGGGY